MLILLKLKYKDYVKYMRAKYLILDFINFVFFLTLISITIIYIIQGNNFEVAWQIIKSLSPIIILIFLLFVKSKLNRRELKQRTSEGEMEIILRLNFFDKIYSDVILFLLPTSLFVIAFILGTTDSTDLIQALLVTVIFYFWQRYIFKKTS